MVIKIIFFYVKIRIVFDRHIVVVVKGWLTAFSRGSLY